ncbi:MAG: citryl-CoA lyase [Hyphomicrobiaceae bacterium]|nr:citryl-CoA lyase [Hyphomicrobiaceae bacterium]
MSDDRSAPQRQQSAASPPTASPEDWWATAIIDMAPGRIHLRGYAIEDLIGNVSYAEMVWLMTRGELPSRAEAALLECALVAAVDHGPQAPSIAAARMAITCGVGINSAMANAANMLGDVHGGAGEQALELYHAIAARLDAGETGLAFAVAAELAARRARGETHAPGFGHRFHPVDPRAPRLLHLVERAAAEGAVGGRFAAIGRAVEAALSAGRSRPIPMNIDGATAVVYAELGFAPALCRGLFVLSRSVGALAHAYEEMRSGARNKGPIPRQNLWTYTGPAHRHLPAGDGPANEPGSDTAL